MFAHKHSLAVVLVVVTVLVTPCAEATILDSTSYTEVSTCLHPCGRKSLRDPILQTLGWQIVGMAALLSMDPKETGFKPPRPYNVFQGLTNAPIWDNDAGITNYVLHPAWGSETYLSARRAGFSPTESFLFSTASSAAWEYLFESWAEHPSIQDLAVTSTIGAVLGELRYVALKKAVRSEAWWADPAVVLLDPFRNITNLTGIQLKMGVGIESR